MIPAGGQISFGEIAEKTGLEKREVRRIVGNAASMHIMRIEEPEMVAHTKVSKFLTIPYINSWVGFESKDTWPGATRVSSQDLRCTRETQSKELTRATRHRLQMRFRNGQILRRPMRL